LASLCAETLGLFWRVAQKELFWLCKTVESVPKLPAGSENAPSPPIICIACLCVIMLLLLGFFLWLRRPYQSALFRVAGQAAGGGEELQHYRHKFEYEGST
jgi:uncharacterized iron-regulated membrane protein